MLNNLSKQIRECHLHAELCALRASVQTDSQLKDIYLEMEQRWLMLARSHEFSQRLDDFSNETKRWGDNLPRIPKRPQGALP
jgi:hypothetical protein